MGRVLIFGIALTVVVAACDGAGGGHAGPSDASGGVRDDAGLDASSEDAPDASVKDTDAGVNGAPYDAGLDTGAEDTPKDSGSPAEPVAPTSCGSAVDFLDFATLGTTGARALSSSLVGALADLSGSCGGGRRERVYRYQAVVQGYLQARVEGSDTTLVLHLRTACEDATSEATCVPSGRETGLLLRAGQAVFVIVDSNSEATDANFTLSMSFLVERGVGDACDRTGSASYCATGLRCETQGAALGTCVTNTAPTLSAATVLKTGRSGTDLFVNVVGADVDGDVTGLGLSLKNGSGQDVLFAGRDVNGAPTDAAGIVAFDADVAGDTDLSATFTWRGFFSRFPSVASVDVWLVDSGGLSCPRLAAAIVSAPVIAAQQPCDAYELDSLCGSGFLCMGAPALCRAGTAPTLDGLAYLRIPGAAAHLMLATTDLDRDLVWATVEFQDAAGLPVSVDADQDGTTESALSFPIAQTEAAAAAFFEVDLTGIEAAAPRLNVQLSDWSGLRSSKLSTTLTDQLELTASSACDGRAKFNRCTPGLACVGQPTAICVPGSAPVWDRSAYLRSGTGDELYLEARDAERDVDQLKLEYLDEDEHPLTAFDTDGDGRADGSTQTATLWNLSYTSGDAFFLPVRVPSVSAPKVAVTLVDRAGLLSERVVLALSNRPTRAENATCSLNGFDACINGTLCVANDGVVPFNGTCTLRETAQSNRCGAATLLNSVGALLGRTGSESLWDPPSYCSASASVSLGNPEGVVRLTLNEAVSSLRVSTDNPGTEFDSVVYVMSGCGTDVVSPPLSCHDDVDIAHGNVRSTVTLTNVGPGDYLIVIDSVSRAGGVFELTVSTP